MSNKKSNSYGAKGYYIALVLCAAAIGVSGFLFYRNDSRKAEQVPAAVQQEEQQAQVPAAATTPVIPQDATTEPTQSQTLPQGPLKTAAPVEGELVAEYAMDCLSYNETTRDWRVHAGLDLAAEPGTVVKAAADGEVYTVYEDDTMGMTVVIRHEGGFTTHYASLSEDVSVKAGDKVSLGQPIGTVGQTALLETALGSHVCFRVTCDGEVMDPMEFLN